VKRRLIGVDARRFELSFIISFLGFRGFGGFAIMI
jgi:hypothetical protein